jgi:hypothetical protein
VKRLSIVLLCVILGGCVQRWVDPPPATDEGAFLVHVVKAPDESLPKILTWYTGTTLSQQIVIKWNPFILQRELRLGDKIVIPMEVVANSNPYGIAPQQQGAKVPNLLMGEGGPPPTAVTGASKTSQEKTKAPPVQRDASDLPPMSLETFNDDTNPDAASVEVGGAVPKETERVKQLQKEIAEKQKELQSLQGERNEQPGDADMPPPGLLQEYEGS